MKYIVNFKDLRTGEILERKVDGLEFTSYEQANNFANECFQNYCIIVLELLDVNNGLSPNSIEYYVETIKD